MITHPPPDFALAPAERMTAYVQTLGRGPGRGRALTRDECRDAFAIMLAGAADPHQVGALLMLLRYRGEGVAEGSGVDPRQVTPAAAREGLLAMAYQISKEIASMGAVLEGKVDAIVLTGGIVYDTEIVVPAIRARVGWMAPVLLFPGGDEMRALRDAAASVLDGSSPAKNY